MEAAGIPETLVYKAKPLAARATKTRLNLPSLNKSSLPPAEIIQVGIPCAPGTYLNPAQSYLFFSAQRTGTQTGNMTLDYSASSFIRQLSVRLGSQVLETISDYHCLYHTLFDSQASFDVHSRAGAILEGMSGATPRTGALVTSTKTYYCIPLVSGVLGTLSNKMLPLGYMAASGLTLELTLAELGESVVCADATASWSISDVDFVAEVVIIDPAVDRAMRDMNPQGVYIPTQTFASHGNLVPSGSANANLLISSNSKSAKTLFTVFRKQSELRLATVNSISGRQNLFGNVGNWNYNIGGVRFPARPVRTNAESFAELMKSLHAFSSVDSMGLHTLSNWVGPEGTYVVAQDLERFSHKSLTSESGINISTLPIYFEASFSGTLTEAMAANTYIHMDVQLYIDLQTGQAQTLY